MSAISLAAFGRDHDSLLLYLETRCVDHGGKPDRRHLRCNPARHPYGHEGGWDDKHTTRLLVGRGPVGHDDWDCVDDLEHAGLLEWRGTGANPVFALTDAGWLRVSMLRRARAERLLRETGLPVAAHRTAV